MNLPSWRSFSTIRGSKSFVFFIVFLLVGALLRLSVATFVLVAISAVLGCRGPGFAGVCEDASVGDAVDFTGRLAARLGGFDGL